jgi:cytochrome c oxidase assembly protein subunit 20
VNEIEGMKQAVELMQELKMKKKREDEQLKISQEAARRVAEEDERRRKSWINFSRYKFW